MPETRPFRKLPVSVRFRELYGSYEAHRHRQETASQPTQEARQDCRDRQPIVTAKKPAKRQAPWADDGQPVLEEVREFFKRMMRPPGA
jgi:hypothetical protein